MMTLTDVMASKARLNVRNLMKNLSHGSMAICCVNVVKN